MICLFLLTPPRDFPVYTTPYFTEKKVKTQKGEATCSKSSCWQPIQIQADWRHSGFSATCHIIPGFILILFPRGASEPRTKEPQSGSQWTRGGISFHELFSREVLPRLFFRSRKDLREPFHLLRLPPLSRKGSVFS